MAAEDGRKKRDRRLAWGELGAALPGGPNYPAHKAGAPWSLALTVSWPGAGDVTLSAPRPSVLLLESGAAHIQRALELKELVPQDYPGHESYFDFLQEAASGLVLIHDALDSMASEQIPQDYRWVEADGKRLGREQILSTKGFESRLTRILAEATGKENLREMAIWPKIRELKDLRDGIAHGLSPRHPIGPDFSKQIIVRVVAADLASLLSAVDLAFDHFMGEP
jgi:hypothetical protein